jgi:hypothetical protein
MKLILLLLRFQCPSLTFFRKVATRGVFGGYWNCNHLVRRYLRVKTDAVIQDSVLFADEYPGKSQ